MAVQTGRKLKTKGVISMRSDTLNDFTTNIDAPANTNNCEQPSLKPCSVVYNCLNVPSSADVTRARKAVEACIDGLDTLMYDRVCFAAGELAANAWRHAKTPFTLECSVTDEMIHLAVTDQGQGFDLKGWLLTPLDPEQLMNAPAPEESLGVGLKTISDECSWIVADKIGRGFCVAVCFYINDASKEVI
jgi:anti-sigma regulatory factor (Ser/Thr protein kinase)